MTKRLIIVPRWGGMPASDWYPWLVTGLGCHEDSFDQVAAAAMPAPEQPTIKAWVARLDYLLGAAPADLERTVLVGHSVGCLAILHYLAAFPGRSRLHGLLLVAAWWRVDRPWDTLLPWCDAPLELEAVRSRSGQSGVLISDDDPFTPNWAANAQEWRERLAASVVVVPGAKHFNAREEPVVLQTVLERFA